MAHHPPSPKLYHSSLCCLWCCIYSAYLFETIIFPARLFISVLTLIVIFQMTDTSYPTMTQQHFSTDHMLTNTIENRQFGTTGEKIHISLFYHNKNFQYDILRVITSIKSLKNRKMFSNLLPFPTFYIEINRFLGQLIKKLIPTSFLPSPEFEDTSTFH